MHESDELYEINKLQYLHQVMVPKSKAAGLISSFPITSENYSKAVQQLKIRFDNASFRSYISDKVIKYLNLKPLRRKKDNSWPIRGEKETAPLEHGIYVVEINDLSGSFKLCSEVASEPDPIEKLLTGKCVTLNFCLAAIHTKLRWTVIGKETGLGSNTSKKAYAACIFVRSVNLDGVKATLVRAKSRVAPLKALSIPHLELMSCCIGARFANSVRSVLDLSYMKITFWTDSSVALW
ncbi:uncharacterized protein TNCV_4918621 [Trichonephila clavipes]|nr:uncharacterized protein TNCV_4918621 [Trichonephila clavipes]